jgi:hypothetical protein
VRDALVAEQRHRRVVVERDMTGDHRPGNAAGLIESQAARCIPPTTTVERAVPVT